MEPSNLQKIIIVDFGSQFTQLVARKIRELGSYSEIINFKNIFKLKNDSSVKGIILSGGPLSITNNKGISLDSFLIQKKIPILGICYGHQILAKKFGGKIKVSKHREFGKAILKVKSNSILTKKFFKSKKKCSLDESSRYCSKTSKGF